MTLVSRPAGARLTQNQLNRANHALGEIVGEDPACPFCGNMRWGTPTRAFLLDPSGGPLRFIGDEQQEAAEIGIDVVLRICTHCGFVRSHVARVLDRQREAGSS